MNEMIFSILTQSLTFLPLALAISMSYHILKATDMTLDGSFVLGAAVFARTITFGFTPVLAFLLALVCGACAGVFVACVQRGGKVDPLLAGVLASFMLSSINLIIMGKPNINLLNQTTLISSYFAQSQMLGWFSVLTLVTALCAIACGIVKSKLGLKLRALGDNPGLLLRLGESVERYRAFGFALTNLLAASAGCITAQTVGYADIGMGFGMTLTGIGAIILGHQLVLKMSGQRTFRAALEFSACVLGVVLYFFSLNSLLRFDVDPLYLKLILGLFLIVFIRLAVRSQKGSNA